MNDIEIISGRNPGDFTKTTFYLPAVGVAVSMGTGGDAASIGGGNPTKTVNSDNPGDKFIYWGTDNLEPQRIIKDVFDNDLIYSVIEKRSKLLYGSDLVYGRLELGKNGRRKVTPFIAPEIENWLKNTSIKTYLKEAAIDDNTFGNVFPEVIMDAHRPRKIKGIYCNDASECRMGNQDNKGRIPLVYVNANWKNDGTAENSAKLDGLDHYFNMAQQIAEKPNVDKWIIPLHSQNLGEKFYSKERWRGLRTSGWLEIAKSIPKWKQAVMKNQLSIKYHLEIDQDWWEHKYVGFKSKKIEEQEELMKKEVQRFISTMQGDEKAGGVLLTSFQYDMHNKTEYSSWKIKEIGTGKFEQNDNLEYASDADRRIMRAFGMHPTIFGATSSKGSAGSGSDVRVANNQLVLEMKDEQDKLLKPLALASEINGWNAAYGGEFQQVVFMTESYFIATLDSGNELSDEDPDEKIETEE